MMFAFHLLAAILFTADGSMNIYKITHRGPGDAEPGVHFAVGMFYLVLALVGFLTLPR